MSSAVAAGTINNAANIPSPERNRIDPATQNWLNRTVSCQRWQTAGTITAVALAVLLVATPLAATGFCIYMAATVVMTAFKVRFTAIAISAFIHAVIGCAPCILLYQEVKKGNYHNPTIANQIVENLRTAQLNTAFIYMSPKEHAKYGFLPDDKVTEIEAMIQRHNTLQAQYRQQAVGNNDNAEPNWDAAKATFTQLTALKAHWITWRQENLIDKHLLPTPSAILRA